MTDDDIYKIQRAADTIETAAHKLALMFEDGYGGGGLRLLEAMEKANSMEAAIKSLMAIKELIIKGDYSDDRAMELINEGLY